MHLARYLISHSSISFNNYAWIQNYVNPCNPTSLSNYIQNKHSHILTEYIMPTYTPRYIIKIFYISVKRFKYLTDFRHLFQLPGHHNDLDFLINLHIYIKHNLIIKDQVCYNEDIVRLQFVSTVRNCNQTYLHVNSSNRPK